MNIVSCVSVNWYFEVGEACLWGHICVTSLLRWICSPIPRALFSYVGVSCWLSPSASWAPGVFGGQALPRSVSYDSVIDFLLMDCLCCTRLIRTRSIVCLVSFHLLMPAFDALELLSQLIHWSLKGQDVERPNFHGDSCPPKFVYGMTFPTTVFDTGTLDGVLGSSQPLVLVLVGDEGNLWAILLFQLRPVLQFNN